MEEAGAISSARERHHQMTMFAMKPKFNLVEFLSAPASKGANKHPGARRFGTQSRAVARSEAATETTPPEEPGSTDRES